MNDLVIIGAGGFAREVGWLVERINNETPTWNLLGFLDDFRAPGGELINGLPALGGISWLEAHSGCYAACAIGDPKARFQVMSGLKTTVRLATLVDPGVQMSRYVEIGAGSIICAGTIITTNIRIGTNVIVNLDCTLGHDCVLEDYVSLMPSVNVSGAVVLQRGVYCGTGANIIQGKTVGAWTTIGAGAVVVNDLPDHAVAVGIPAKAIKRNLPDEAGA